MTDSVSVFMPLDPTMTMQEYLACNFPFKASKHLDQDDFMPIAEDGVPKPPDQRRPYQKFFKVNALTGAGFRARAQWADYNYPGGISGYEVEINVPTCLIGHNVLIDRSVPRAMELAVLQMQLFLLSRVNHPRGVYAIDVDSAILLNTTITNSYKHGSKAEAHQGRRNYQARTELFNHANKRNRYAKNEKLPATTFGPSGAGTSYLKGRDGDQVSYVKDRDAPSEARFPSKEVEAAIYDHGETIQRIETELKARLLAEMGRTTAESWRRYGTNPYAVVDQLLDKTLQITQNLRSRRPKPEAIAALGEPDRGIVTMHLDGKDWTLHPFVLAYPEGIKRQKYVSAVKRRVLKLRINLAIPWVEQVKAMEGNLNDVVRPENLDEGPLHLARYYFTDGASAELARHMRLNIARGCNAMVKSRGIKDFPIRALAAVDVGPPVYDPTLIDFSRITTSKQARHLLDSHKRPLYHFLQNHGLGCFGDISLAEVDANRVAQSKREPVKSMFRIGERELWIKTSYKPDQDGELQPHVEVTT